MLLNDKLEPYRLLLASQSPRRRELMTGCGLPYELAEKFDCEETYPDDLPLIGVSEYLSTLKSEAYPVPLLENDILLTADTVVLAGGEFRMTAEGSTWHGGEILGKPRDRDDARRMLKILSGAHHLVTTGVTLRSAARMTHFTSLTYVWFRTLTDEEIAARRDMRGVATFTIDPADAKDFDDALSIRRLENGNYEVGVHIADVTHYVHPGDLIDTEGQNRATSVYLVDRTIPMLPERLSNGLCSLRPHEEKLCFSAVFELDEQAQVLGEWFGRTVIYSDRRFTYQEAQEVIETGRGDFADEILKLNGLAQTLRKERFRNGSISFEREEAKFDLDENGKPLRVYFKEMKESNQLIEEFMLLANRRVAEFVGRKRKGAQNAERTFVYRVHDKPNSDKMAQFRSFVLRFGYQMKAEGNKAVAKEINLLMKKIHGKKEENIISTLAIRSMAKATYTTDNIGHYGLAFDYYTHFTSPIRRYPDMMVHRLLAHYLAGGKSEDKEYYERLCEHCSAMEVRAADAERASIKYKMVEFMLDKLNEEFDGHISGITEWGIYVELEDTKIEGMVALRDMTDDFYLFDEENYSVKGREHGRTFTLGDEVRIRVVRADLQRKQLDFDLVASYDFDTKEATPVE